MFSLRCLPGRRPLRRVQGLRDHEGRTAEYLRAQILEAFGFRPATAGEAEELAEALLAEAAPYEYDAERLKGAACTRLRALKIEPGCRVLHSIALPVVSEWCQQRPRVHLPLRAHFAKAEPVEDTLSSTVAPSSGLASRCRLLEHLATLPRGARAELSGVESNDHAVRSHQPRCRGRRLLPSTGSPDAIHAFLPSPYSRMFV